MLSRENFAIYLAVMRPIFLFLFLCSFLSANEEIVVHLSSKSDLPTIYLAKCVGAPKEVEEVLRFDLSCMGSAEMLSENPQWESYISQENYTQCKADYIVKSSVQDNKLSLSIVTKKSGSVQRIENVQLSGTHADRKVVHQVADRIHELLFGKPGIATTKILYTIRTRTGENSSKWVSEVWEADYDGAAAKKLTNDGALSVTPTYLPHCVQGHFPYFFYVSYREGQPKIYLGNNGQSKRVTYIDGNQLMPAVSPQKNKIAFICDVAGNPDLFMQSFSVEKGVVGKAYKIFSAPFAAQGTPVFSPDGKKLAFVSNKDGSPRIYMITIPEEGAAQKSKPFLISKQNRDNTSPSFSPDGRKMAYSAMTKGVRQIWTYDFAEGRETQLTYGSANKENPVWAPNSMHLLFNSETYEGCELYMINLHQKEAVKISRGPGEKRFPAWEPKKNNV